VVHPAAGLINLARRRSDWLGTGERAKVIEANLTETVASHAADIGLYGPSGQTLPRVIEAMS
jgi:NAD-dependent protein deacetylase/lipoamidase